MKVLILVAVVSASAPSFAKDTHCEASFVGKDKSGSTISTPLAKPKIFEVKQNIDVKDQGPGFRYQVQKGTRNVHLELANLKDGPRTKFTGVVSFEKTVRISVPARGFYKGLRLEELELSCRDEGSIIGPITPDP